MSCNIGIDEVTLRSIFATLDEDKSGSLDLNEFEQYLHSAALGKGLMSPQYGVGIEIRRAATGEIVVQKVLPDTPADGKIRVNDVILHIDRKDMHGRHPSDVWESLHGVRTALTKSTNLATVADPESY